MALIYLTKSMLLLVSLMWLTRFDVMNVVKGVDVINVVNGVDVINVVNCVDVINVVKGVDVIDVVDVFMSPLKLEFFMLLM